jgi:hypothetical protein
MRGDGFCILIRRTLPSEADALVIGVHNEEITLASLRIPEVGTVGKIPKVLKSIIESVSIDVIDKSSRLLARVDFVDEPGAQVRIAE